MDTRSTAAANARLREEFGSVIAPETVDEVFRQSTLDLVEAARIENFVPLLAERLTRERLIALAHA
jgi:hypothetical protein